LKKEGEKLSTRISETKKGGGIIRVEEALKKGRNLKEKPTRFAAPKKSSKEESGEGGLKGKRERISEKKGGRSGSSRSQREDGRLREYGKIEKEKKNTKIAHYPKFFKRPKGSQLILQELPQGKILYYSLGASGKEKFGKERSMGGIRKREEHRKFFHRYRQSVK